MSNFSFIDKKNIKNSSFILDEKESHHIISVLRLKENSNLTLTDGQGKVYHAVIIELNKKSVKGKILREEKILNEQKYLIHLALPLIKNNRFKIALEKSNYSKVKNLSKTFLKVCKKLCKKNESILETLNNIEPKNNES